LADSGSRDPRICTVSGFTEERKGRLCIAWLFSRGGGELKTITDLTAEMWETTVLYVKNKDRDFFEY